MKKINIHSISFKLIAGGCVLVLLPLIVIGVLSVMKSTTALLEVANDKAENHALQIAGLVEQTLLLQSQSAAAFASGCNSYRPSGKVRLLSSVIETANFSLSAYLSVNITPKKNLITPKLSFLLMPSQDTNMG